MDRGFKRKFFLLLLTIALILLANSFVFKNFIPNSFYYFFKSPGNFFSNKILNIPNYLKGIFYISQTERQNMVLRSENLDLTAKLVSIETLERENEILRSELGFVQKNDRKLEIAKIFNIEKSVISSSILINRGESDGLKEKMAVITDGNVLVGMVNQVFKNSSRVMLVNDPNFIVSVRIATTQILANTKGGLDKGIIVNLIMTKDLVNESDLIITSGLDGFMEGLVVGKIKNIDSKPGDLFKDVLAQPLFNFSLGPNVFIIKE